VIDALPLMGASVGISDLILRFVGIIIILILEFIAYDVTQVRMGWNGEYAVEDAVCNDGANWGRIDFKCYPVIKRDRLVRRYPAGTAYKKGIITFTESPYQTLVSRAFDVLGINITPDMDIYKTKMSVANMGTTF